LDSLTSRALARRLHPERGLGEHDQAMNWLNKAHEARFNPSILLRPADTLRSEARFQDLLRRIGLPSVS
jgi:hypothetical protein